MDKRFMLVVLAIVGLFAGFIIFSAGDDAAKSEDGQKYAQAIENEPFVINEFDQTKGSGDITIIEYADFSCGACAAFFPTGKQIAADFPEDVTMAFRHRPLHQKWPHYAAVAAQKQDKFWQMHDLLYENQNVWGQASNPKEAMVDLAQQLDLDIEKFEADYDSEELHDFVNDANGAAIALEINSTPTLFINGEEYNYSEVNTELIEKLIDEQKSDNSANADEDNDGE